VRDVREELYRSFMAKCGDHNESERLAIEVCEEFGLPDVRTIPPTETFEGRLDLIYYQYAKIIAR